MLGNILQLVLLFFWMGILPLLVGCLWTNKMKEYRNSVFMASIMGFMTMFAVFQLLAVPMIIMTVKLSVLLYSWCSIMLALLIISVLINRKRFAEIIKFTIEKIKNYKNEKYMWIVISAAVVLILVQATAMSYLWYDADDDRRYVTVAVDAYSTDTMLQYNPFTGELVGHPEGELWKDTIGPINMFWAMLSRLIMTHPAIVMHMLVPLVFIPLGYMIYALFGNRLFHGNEKMVAVFIFVLSCIIIYGRYDLQANLPLSLLVGLRWGKSMQTAISIPFIIFLCMNIMDEKENRVYYPVLFCTLLATCMMTTMAAIIPTMVIAVYGIIHFISSKKIKYLINPLICCLPGVFYGILYYLVR